MEKRRPNFGASTPLLVLLMTATSAADPPETIRRLPPIDVIPPSQIIPADDILLFLPASDPPEFRTPGDMFPPPQPHLQPHKKGFFQKLAFTTTAILPDGNDGLGILEMELLAAFAVPAPSPQTPLLLIPTLQVDFVDHPAEVVLPGTLYAGLIEFVWLPKLGARTLGVLAVAPGWYSDFRDGDSGAFRLTGRALARYDWQPDRVQLVLGAAYLNRVHSRWIPVGGVIWMPSADLHFELVFPQTKVARRTLWGRGFEHWIYLTGGFGGNDWAVVRPDGSRDRLGLLDWRITAGWERRMDGGAGLHFEVGYVFSREIRFASADERFSPGDTLLLRAGIAF